MRGVDTDWPALTLIRSDELEALAAELAASPRSVADELLRPELDGSTEELVVEARAELERGLRRLRSWIARAAAPQARMRSALAPSGGNDPLPWMDGDQ